MHRIAVRRRTMPWGSIVAGLGVGLVAGFVLGEVAGPAAKRAIKRASPVLRPKRSVAEMVLAAQSALDDDLPLRESRLKVIPIGPGRLELHGWVSDRRSRTRAGRIVSDAMSSESVINRVQVHGEDDVTDNDQDDTADEVPA